MRLQPNTVGFFLPCLLRRRIGRGGGGANNSIIIPYSHSRVLSSSSTSSSSSSLRLLQLCTDVSSLKQLHARYIIHGLLYLFTSQLVSSYARLRHLPLSLDLFRHFHRHHSLVTSPDHYSIFLALIRALSKSSLHTTHNDYHLVFGMTLHSLVVKLGYHPNDHSLALLSMYSNMGSLDMACSVFDKMLQYNDDDSAAWNLIIAASSRQGRHRTTLQLLARMGKRLIWPDLSTAIAAVSAASELKALSRGREIHAHLVSRVGSLSFDGGRSLIPLHNTLLEMYVNCGCLDQGRTVFYQLGEEKTLVSWSLMIKAYVTHDQSSHALSLHEEMKLEGVKLDVVTIINILQACVQVGALQKVIELHLCSIKLGFDLDTTAVTALLVSYAKCGCIDTAQKLVDEEEAETKDVISWNSMITAYAKHGNWPQCFKLYSSMKKSSNNVKPDCVTFIGLLTACVNSGLVDEGWKCFMEMVDVYGCQPKQEHYACMVDLLGRHGRVDEAMKLIQSMPFNPDVRVWGPLLSACKLHSQPALAEFAAQRLIGMEPKNAGNYVLISNIYAAAGKWEQVAKMRSSLRDRGLKKTPGCSWLEINGCVHEFKVADTSHPSSQDIYAILKNLQSESTLSKEMMITGLEQPDYSLHELL